VPSAITSRLLKISTRCLKLQKDYTALWNLDARPDDEHGMKPDDFLDFRAQVDHSPLSRMPPWVRRSSALRRNYSSQRTRRHATRVLARLELEGHFEMCSTSRAELDPSRRHKTTTAFSRCTTLIPASRGCRGLARPRGAYTRGMTTCWWCRAHPRGVSRGLGAEGATRPMSITSPIISSCSCRALR